MKRETHSEFLNGSHRFIGAGRKAGICAVLGVRCYTVSSYLRAGGHPTVISMGLSVRHYFFSISHRAGFVMGELLISDGDQTVGLHGMSGGGNVPGFLRLGLSNKLN